jgi:hypothetical protein
MFFVAPREKRAESFPSSKKKPKLAKNLLYAFSYILPMAVFYFYKTTHQLIFWVVFIAKDFHRSKNIFWKKILINICAISQLSKKLKGKKIG